ncbi:MFS transporter [soil metagenome]
MTTVSPGGAPPPAPAEATPALSKARGRTFEALGEPRYRRLWLMGAASFLAVNLQIIARGWLALELTGSNTGLGGVYLGFGIPMLLATPLGGVAADRLPKRPLLFACQALLASTALWIGLAVAFDVVAYWMLVATSALQAVGFAFLGPARMAFTGELVGRDRLSNAVVLGQLSLNGARVIGPAMAGILIGVPAVGTEGVYLIAATLTVVACGVALTLPRGEPRAGRPVRSAGADLADGLSYVRRRPTLVALLVTSFVVVMVAFPYVAFLPSVASDLFDVGSGGYGAMSAASAVGAIAASLLIAGRANGAQAWRIQTWAGVAFGVTIVLLAVSPTLPIALLAIVGTGAAASAFQGMNNSLALGLSDLEYHGRVQSLMMLSFSGFGMAALPLGALADAIGLRQTLVAMGVVTLLAMAAFVFLRPGGGGWAQEDSRAR